MRASANCGALEDLPDTTLSACARCHLESFAVEQPAKPSTGNKNPLGTRIVSSHQRSGDQRPRGQIKAKKRLRLAHLNTVIVQLQVPKTASARFVSSRSNLHPQAAAPFPAPTSITLRAHEGCVRSASRKYARCVARSFLRVRRSFSRKSTGFSCLYFKTRIAVAVIEVG